MTTDNHISLPGTRREIGYRHTSSPFLDLFLSLLVNRSFIAAVARRDLMAKYKGAFIGVVWMVGTPAALVVAYGFMIFGVFSFRTGDNGTALSIVTLWFCVSLWQTFAETISRSASVVAENASLVKRSTFPLSSLPPAVMLTAFMGLAVSLSLGVLAYSVFVGIPPLSWFRFLYVAPPFVLMTLAGSYLTATIGAFSKDIRHILPLGLTVCMLMTPVLYPASKVPPALRFISDYNPLTPVFESVRIVVEGGNSLPWWTLGMVTALSLAGAVYAFKLYRRKSVEFADVL